MHPLLWLIPVVLLLFVMGWAVYLWRKEHSKEKAFSLGDAFQLVFELVVNFFK